MWMILGVSRIPGLPHVVRTRCPWTGLGSRSMTAPPASPPPSTGPADILLVSSPRNGVTTMTMNNPKKLNGWTLPMMQAMQSGFQRLAQDPDTQVVILTGSDPYYCAGVNLSDTIRPMHPKTLHQQIYANNKRVFDTFLDFPKPIIIAANGPAIGASVTTASLSDAIVASEKATFSTPFARLSVPPEGCSSIHFARIMGPASAQRLLGPEGWVPTAAEAHQIGLVSEVVPHGELMARAQALAEAWVQSGKKRWLVEQNAVEEYKAVNDKESRDLADAFLGSDFLLNQYHFLKSKNKTNLALVFYFLYSTRNLWIKLV
ncbi:hypothetical protein TCAL_08436 [Tigriopus californicus]|uniref:Uncharacterized protein n=1 Tax=Tigriopus californicus TaxID=6832 RepID=A0A553P2F5_TIGCA|nr:uncharacterized protein B0272.4-like [Tigriopus californicus]TRY71887.1 hypothetical protein TCAL_08436 [Tigriopus californicus]